MADELNPQASMQSLQALADELALRSEAQEGRCIDLSELSEAAQAAELSDDDVQLLQELLQDPVAQVAPSAKLFCEEYADRIKKGEAAEFIGCAAILMEPLPLESRRRQRTPTRL